MPGAIAKSKVLPQNTINRLFSILDDVKKSEKGELIKDWIVRYGGHNPIFEETDDDNMYTVFLLVRNNTTDHWEDLYLVGDSFGWDIPSYTFEPINDTRWWYAKFKRPKGARLHYMLSPNDLGTRITDETRLQRYKNFILDERNPNCIDEGLMEHSFICLPGFKDVVEKKEVQTEFNDIYMRNKLDGKRNAQFCTIGDSNSPEKLMIVHDGAAFSKVMEGHKIIANGIEEGRWPNLAILTLNSPYSEREREYGGRYGYPKYFKNVIIPTVEHHLGKTFDPEDIILHGSSLGAWALLDVVAQVDVADNLILHSCPYWWPDDDHQKYMRELKESDEFKIDKFYFDVGVYETGREPMSTYESNQKFAAILEEKDIEYMGREYFMGHRYNSWAWALPAALDYVIHGKKEYGPLPGKKLEVADIEEIEFNEYEDAEDTEEDPDKELMQKSEVQA